MISYLSLFFSALVAATIIPMQSEAVLVGLLATTKQPAVLLIIVATVGNVLGAVINWWLGGYLLNFQENRWFPSSQSQLARAQIWYHRYGRWTLIGSWLPFIGDPITVIAGVMREPLISFLLLVSIAKGLRYLFLAIAAQAFF
ncbi:DedA family protein [Ascidiaceihabitans sp.]|nr:DedA family protein [Ascidiaceihabitans sp.]